MISISQAAKGSTPLPVISLSKTKNRKKDFKWLEHTF